MAKVLLVLDGGYRFSALDGIADFTFTGLLDGLTGGGHQVTKAHRQADSSADIQNFNFETSVNLLDYDVLWMVGKDGRNEPTSVGTSGPGIGDTEIRAISRFMAAGGGVFATGDHDSIGAEMCGHVPRVRAMRSWYGINDSASPMPVGFPRNFPSITAGRADTTQRNPTSNYGGDPSFVWFENQSDTIPQPITPAASPAHPILRQGGNDIVIYPDHMHEGDTLAVVPGYDYGQSLMFGGESFAEFPEIAGVRQMPEVIATGQTMPYANKYAVSNAYVGGDSAASGAKTINTLCVYEGRNAGVGRIVTGSTFHHYIDINLTGDSSVTGAPVLARTGPEPVKGGGFAYPGAGPKFDTIKTVYANIATWLARPRPAIQLILERSTFSQAEAQANNVFADAILVTVDGLKPSQFPGGGIDSLAPADFDPLWAPTITPTDPQGLTITPTKVESDDPMLPERLQRFTFTYQVEIKNNAWGGPWSSKNIRVDASLTSPSLTAPLTDSAFIQLTKSANPFMLDLANGNTTAWLSSDLRILPVVAGTTLNGVTLPANATRAQAIDFLRQLVSTMSVAEFEAIDMTQPGSALSPFPTTTGNPPKNVYNFAVARVRLPASGAAANDVRVFFRIFTSQTTAALTYNEVPAGTPIDGYKRTPNPGGIALPGTNSANSEWISFPMFSAERAPQPQNQVDTDNHKMAINPGTDTFFGALVDNNLGDPYLSPTPMGGGAVGLPTLMMGEHQCIVAQIEYAGTIIPNTANPFTSDKLAQRNIAFNAIANPGVDASRVAVHTFEIEANPGAIAADQPPDELLLDWRGGPPDGTEVRLYMPGHQAQAIVELADRFYARHEIRAVDDHTVALPGGGTRYIPLPRSDRRQTGVLSAHFPLGVVKGQRFNLAVRQVTNRARVVEAPPKVTKITRAQAAKLLAPTTTVAATTGRRRSALPLGVFDIGKNKTLVTDLRVIDAEGSHALIIETDPKKVEAAARQSARWRQTVGAFQLGVPVSVKGDMLAHHLRLLSVLRWRAEHLRPASRWYATFLRYVEMIADKVRALGGDPWGVPTTPDGNIDWPGKDGGAPGAGGLGPTGTGDSPDPWLEPGSDDWLGGTDGLPAADRVGAGIWSGKVSGLIFDHFGDFEGFTLESYAGSNLRFYSRETAIMDLAKEAWLDRYVVTVITVAANGRKVRRLLIRGYSD